MSMRFSKEKKVSFLELDQIVQLEKRLKSCLDFFDLYPDKIVFDTEKHQQFNLKFIFSKAEIQLKVSLLKDNEISISIIDSLTSQQKFNFIIKEKISAANIIEIIYLLEKIQQEKNKNYQNDFFNVAIVNSFLNDEIEYWHQSKNITQDLSEFLGLSESEYAEWVQEPKIVFNILKSHLSNDKK